MLFKRTFSISLVIFCLFASRDAYAGERPNIVLIMADDFGYECLSCNGSTSYKTPHLDQLAEHGARFTHCYSTPLCTPSRVLIMTGRYGFRNYKRFGILAKSERTFGHMLRAAGYATVLVGKWQLGSHNGPGQNPRDAGFDAFCVWNYQNREGQALGNRYADPNLIYFDRKTGKSKLKSFKGGYGPDICTDYMLDFVDRSVKSKKPFLAYYSMILTHNPFLPTPDSAIWKTGNRLKEKGTTYFKDMVEYTDVLVGRIVAKLDELGVRKNTLIIFTGDNGTHNRVVSMMRGGIRIRGGKGFPTNAGTRVPLIVNWQGKIKPKQVTNQLVDFSDFLPVIADATGAKRPTPPGDGILDGISFLPPLLGQKAKTRQWVYNYYVEPRQDNFGWPKSVFVCDHRYKLYGYYERKIRKGGKVIVKTGQMFDIVADPNEMAPLEIKEGSKLSRVRSEFRGMMKKLESSQK